MDRGKIKFDADLKELQHKYDEMEKRYVEEIETYKKKQEELELKLLFFEGIANSTFDGFLVVDPNGQKILQTQRTIELWKIPQDVVDDSSGKKQVEHVMYMTTEPQKFIDEINYQREHPYEKRLDEIELIDGTIMERYSSPVIDADGKNHGRIWTFHDITERKKIEKNLVQLNKFKDRFISVLAHDLRGPVSNLLSFSELLKEEFQNLTSEKTEEMVNMINISANKTFELLDDTLAWANANLNNIIFKPASIKISNTISEVCSILEPLAINKSISLINKAEDDITANADVYMLKAILRNLVSNAIKFTNEGGKIEISASSDSMNTIIQVKDNGIGISDKNKIKLFNISSTYSTKGTSNETGTGLGLLLCKEFIDKHGGKIWIDSQENNGTSVIFSIPKGKQYSA